MQGAVGQGLAVHVGSGIACAEHLTTGTEAQGHASIFYGTALHEHVESRIPEEWFIVTTKNILR